MIEQAYDRYSVGRYVEAVRGVLGSDQLREATAAAAQPLPGPGDAPAKVSAALTPAGAAEPSSGGAVSTVVPYLSRDPAVSLVQSALDGALREQGVADRAPLDRSRWATIVHTAEELLHPGDFSPEDPDWVIKIAESMLGHLGKGNHPFNPRPAAHAISDSARLVVVGDWGTGLPRARAVASYMAEEVADALAHGREAHVIHLGDVYYSGLPSEVQRHVLDCWPVTADQARAGVTSWSLNGNHDMYSGGFGYFQTLLGDPRFAAQRSADGAATSFFRLTSPSWDFAALDTSWDEDVLFKGGSGVLQDPQADFVAGIAQASARKLVLLSHHQLMSAYDPADLTPVLPTKLGPVLRSGRVTAWWWGHEHRCMGFESGQGVPFPRCLGHGGVPVLQPHAPGDPVPAPGAWEERGFLEDTDGNHWARFGFSILDLDGGQIHVRYRDDTGAEVRSEDIG
jgi:Calcineurin-like phosphoesterase